MAEKPLRLALVGLGGHGQRIQDAVARTPAFRVDAVYDPDVNAAAAAAGRFGCSAAPSFEVLLERGGLDAIALATPNALHRPQAQAALAAGLDVFVEKPIAGTVADGRAMVEEAENAGRILMVGHNIRFGRAAREAKALLDDGVLGEVVSIEIHYSADNVQKGTHQGWRFVPGQVALLPLMQLGLHAVDLVHYLVAPTRWVVAHARSVLTGPGVVDNVTGCFVLENRVAGTVISNYCTPDFFEVRISGTLGVLEINWIPHTLILLPRGRRTPQPVRHDYTAFDLEDQIRQFTAFAEAIGTRTPPETDGRTGLLALAVVEAMARSAEAGVPMTISEVFKAEPEE